MFCQWGSALEPGLLGACEGLRPGLGIVLWGRFTVDLGRKEARWLEVSALALHPLPTHPHFLVKGNGGVGEGPDPGWTPHVGLWPVEGLPGDGRQGRPLQ